MKTTVPAQTALLLRDAALLESADGRKEAIRLVRLELLAIRKESPHLFVGGFTSDWVLVVADKLGILEPKEAKSGRRWTANVLVGWDAVVPTDDYRISRDPACKGRPKKVWRWR